MKAMKLIFSFTAGVALSGAAWAHHSYAVFDNTKEVTVSGTVKEFQWTAPHSWLQVMVPGKNGAAVEWSIESSSPIGLKRMGWSKSALKPGDKIKVTLHPLKDGRPGGSIVQVVTATGEVLKVTA